MLALTAYRIADWWMTHINKLQACTPQELRRWQGAEPTLPQATRIRWTEPRPWLAELKFQEQAKTQPGAAHAKRSPLNLTRCFSALRM
jgi:hypothetical protein